MANLRVRGSGGWSVLVLATIALVTGPAPAEAERFGRDGVIELPPGQAGALVALPSGKLLVAGTGDCGGRGRDFVVRRLRRNGAIDRSFGRLGMACHDAGRLVGERLSTAIRRPSREIVLVGHRRSGRLHDSLVMSLKPDGRLNRDFGTGGRTLIDAAKRESIEAVDVVPRGRLLLGHESFAPDSLLRLRRSGEIDRSWPAVGRRAPTPWVLQPGGSEVHKRRDGRILVGRAFGFRVTRLHPGGRRDPTFGGDGSVSIRNPGIPLAEDMEIEQDGDIALTGKVFGGGPGRPFLTARYRPNGTLDTSFGQNGRQTTSFVTNPDDSCNESARAEDLAEVRGRRLLVVGAVRKPLRTDCRLVAGVVRYLPDGSPDPSFDGDGRLVIRRAQTNRSDNIVVAVQRRTGHYVVASGSGRIVRIKAG